MTQKKLSIRLIADSCCELPPDLITRLDAVQVPLYINLGDDTITDKDVDSEDFIKKMKANKGHISSACPPPDAYLGLMGVADMTFVITLSAKLSGSYSSAVNAATEAETRNDGKRVHVFDSMSAAAGETLAGLKLASLYEEGKDFDEIVALMTRFIKEIETLFVLNDCSNFVKSGRISKLVGFIVTNLNIKMILGSDGAGAIKVFKKVIGGKVIDKLCRFIGERKPDTKGKTLVITHCMNQEKADYIAEFARQNYEFSDIRIMRTQGVSSMYANDGGIIVAF